MRLISLIILILLSTSIYSQYNSNSKSFENIEALSNERGVDYVIVNLNGFHKSGDGGGGQFRWNDTSTATPITGMIIEVPGVATGRWERIINGSISFKAFGAKGIGLEGRYDDSLAFRQMAKWLWAYPKYRDIYFPGVQDTVEQYYCKDGSGDHIPSFSHLHGAGKSSRILVVDPSADPIYEGTIWYTTTYATDSANNPYVKLRDAGLSYPIEDVEKGQSYFIFTNVADTVHFPIGKLLHLASRPFYKGVRRRMQDNETNKIVRYSDDTAWLFKPTFCAISADTGTARVYDINNGITISNRWGIHDYMSEGISIHDLSLEQSDYDLVHDEPYDENSAPGPLIGLGGTFNSDYYNLTIKGFGTFGGNLFQFCRVHDISLIGARKLVDFGFSTSGVDYYNITWNYNKTFIPENDKTTAFIYIDDGHHELNFHDVTASGTWTGTNIIKVATGCKDIHISNVRFNLPFYRHPTSAAIDITDESSELFSDRLFFDNIKIEVDSIGRYIDYSGKSGTTPDRYSSFTNLSFKGKPNWDSAPNTVQITNTGVIYMRNVRAENVDTFFVNNTSEQSVFIDIVAPTAYLNNVDNPNLFSGSSFFRETASKGIRLGRVLRYAEGTNTMVGINACDSCAIANSTLVTAVGSSAGENFKGGTRSTFVGAFAFKGLDSVWCDSCTAVGGWAAPNLRDTVVGITSVGAGTLSTARDNEYVTAIGTGANVQNNSSSWAIALGAYARADSYELAVSDSIKYLQMRGILYEMPTTAPTEDEVPIITNGSALYGWILGSKLMTVATNQTTTSNGTNTITGLSYALKAGKKYRIQAKVRVSSSTANGVKIAATYSGTATLLQGEVFGFTTGLTAFQSAPLPDLAGTSAGTWATVSSTQGFVNLDFTITTTTTGTVGIQYASQTGGDTTTAYAGSWMEVKEER